jgi:hypothetical protein
MDIADEYQAVMVENEEENYWESIDMWDDELKQRDAISWVKSTMKEQQTKTETPPCPFKGVFPGKN